MTALVPLDLVLTIFIMVGESTPGDPDRRVKPLSHSPALFHTLSCSHCEVSTEIIQRYPFTLTFLMSAACR